MVVIPTRSAEVILADIHELRSAIASGTLEVWKGDRKVRFQSIESMILAENRLVDEYAQATSQVQSAISFAKFTRA